MRNDLVRFFRIFFQFLKYSGKYDEFRIRAQRARNEYLLCVDAANAALNQYFSVDMPEMIDVV